MSLGKCCFVSDNGLVAFAKAVGSLESLQLEECNRITETGILNAISNCNSKLKSLTIIKCMGIKGVLLETPTFTLSISSILVAIRSCQWFNSTSLALVGKLCSQLHHLDLNGLCGIRDDALLPLLDSCESLMKVNLSDCVNLTDQVIVALIGFHGGRLELLNLEGCKKVTDKSLIAIVDTCVFLNDLDVSKCSITDSGVAALSNGVNLNLQLGLLFGIKQEHSSSSETGRNFGWIKSPTLQSIEQLAENLWTRDILS